MPLLIDYLPEHFKNIEEISLIMDIVQTEMETLKNYRKKLLNNQFVKTADEFGIGKLENIFSLRQNNNLSLEDRRFAILLEMNDKRPVTINYLREKLNEICGENNFTIIKNYSGNNIEIRLATEKGIYIDVIKNLIKKIIPCNMTSTVDLLYSVYEDIDGKYSTLENKTHDDIKERIDD